MPGQNYTSHTYGHDIRELTIGKMVADRAAATGDKLFLHFLPDGRKYTYRDLDTLTNRVANGFAALGIGHGSHVAVLVDNCPEQILLYCALAKLGAVVAPVNPAARGALLEYFLNLSDAVALVTTPDLAERFAEVRQATPAIGRLVLIGDTPPAGLDLPCTLWRDVEAHDASPPKAEVKFSDPVMIFFTSGTTGPSKGILYTHAKVLLGLIAHEYTYGYRKTDVIYSCLPMFHTGALLLSVFLALVIEGSAVVSGRFSVSRFWDEVRECGATATNLMGSMVNFLWSREPAATDRQHELRLCLSTPMPKFAPEFEHRFGMRFVSGYGLSDFGPVAAFTLSDPTSKLGSSGKPRFGYDIRIVDSDDFDVPVGQTGEIVLRTSLLWDIASGYYKNPQATVDTWRNGWFHTGDRGYLDTDGYLWYVDRKKDAIRRRGENVSAFEVEQVLLRHPAIADVAVYAVDSDTSEDEVAAAIILREGARLTEAEVIGHAQKNLAYFMVPRFVRIEADLPRTLTGKIEKYRLREEAKGNPGAMWDRERAGIVVRR